MQTNGTFVIVFFLFFILSYFILWKVIFRSFLQQQSVILCHQQQKRRQTATITNCSFHSHWHIWVSIFRAARVYLNILCSAARAQLAIFWWIVFFPFVRWMFVWPIGKDFENPHKMYSNEADPNQNKYQFGCHDEAAISIGSANDIEGDNVYVFNKNRL